MIDGFEFLLTTNDAKRIRNLGMEWGDEITTIVDERIAVDYDFPEEVYKLNYFGTEIDMLYRKAYHFAGEDVTYFTLMLGHHDLPNYAYVNINSQTGKMYNAYMGNIKLDPVFGEINTAEELLEAADEFMRIQGVKTSEYKRIYYTDEYYTDKYHFNEKLSAAELNDMSEDDGIFERGDRHAVYYYQDLGSITTDNLCYVVIDHDGSISGFYTRTPGNFGLYPEIEIDMEAYTAALYKLLFKLSGGYEKKGDYNISFSITRDSKGTPMLCANVFSFEYYKSVWDKIFRRGPANFGSPPFHIYTPIYIAE
jgi:hypothetical protein